MDSNPPQNYQSRLNSIKQRMFFLLITKKFSDCTFAVGVGDTEIVTAHKFVLATASPVLKSIFYGNTPKNCDAPIEVNDIEVGDFKDFLKFIYIDTVDLLSHQKAMHLYYAAQKYMVEPLKEQCRSYMMSNLNADNVCPLFDFARQHEIKNLQKACLWKIRNETSTVLRSKAFSELDISSLEVILNQAELQINTELELFNALERYADYRIFSNERKKVVNETEHNGNENNSRVAGNRDAEVSIEENLENVVETEFVRLFKAIVRKIRFLTMTSNEFARVGTTTRLLTSQQSFSILMCISEKSNVHNHFPKDFTTATNSRQPLPRSVLEDSIFSPFR